MVAALRIAAQHMAALPQPDLAAFAAQYARAGLPEEAAVAASRAPEEITALVAMLQGAPDKVPLALEAAGVHHVPSTHVMVNSGTGPLKHWKIKSVKPSVRRPLSCTKAEGQRHLMP